MSQQPSPGRVVLAVGGGVASNGTDVAPALITRSWGENADGSWTVNAIAFPDASPPKVITSVRLYADEESARSDLPYNSSVAACWPPRVG